MNTIELERLNHKKEEQDVINKKQEGLLNALLPSSIESYAFLDEEGKEVDPDSKLCTQILFYLHNSRVLKMQHSQDCCEKVYLEDIDGDPSWLTDIRKIEIVSDCNFTDDMIWYSHVCTFYKIFTGDGVITLRWHGESNGYYFESVNIFIGYPTDNKIKFVYLI